MTAELMGHLWQSTFFALAAGLLTLAFRKNRASVRYWLWLSASLKFFIPFAVLLDLGRSLETLMPVARQIAAPVVSYTLERFSGTSFPESLPTTSSAPDTTHWVSIVLVSVWLCGFTTVALIRFRNWLRVRAAVRASTATNVSAAVEVRVSPGLLEPGVVGLVRPILLLPEGIAERLTPSELNAVLAHELCHIRRRDNLFAALHMMVEAIFWFHPLVWWIGARLVDERERACDEEVLRLGNRADVYADAILNICKLYVESPLVCVSGVSGAGIRQRIETIMSNRKLQGLNRAKKLLLAAAGFAALCGPIAIGLLIGVGGTPTIHAQPVPPAAKPKFDVVSVRRCATSVGVGRGGGGGARLVASSGRLYAECQTLATLIRYAYLGYNYGETESHRLVLQEFKGIPAWGNSDSYTIEATGTGAETREMILGPMLRTLLADRFSLQTHRETREIPVYDLVVARGGAKLQPTREGSCVPRDPNAPLVMPGPGVAHVCGMTYKSPTDGSHYMYGTTMARLCTQFSAYLDLDVVDKTGLTGAFDIRLDLSSEDLSVSPTSHTDSQASAIFAAITSLGLKLQSAKGSGEFMVVDHVERPSEN